MCLNPIVFSRRDNHVTRKQNIKRAIHHAQTLCSSFEDTLECKLAWGVVDELCAADRKMCAQEKAEQERQREHWEDMSDKEFDL